MKSNEKEGLKPLHFKGSFFKFPLNEFCKDIDPFSKVIPDADRQGSCISFPWWTFCADFDDYRVRSFLGPDSFDFGL